MRAVLLYSAAVHIAALGLLAAFAVRSWLDARRPKEPGFPEMATLAAVLGGAVAVIATLMMWPARGFGHGLIAGLVAGALAAVTFLLALGAWPQRPSHGGPASFASRMTGLGFLGIVLLLDLVAFCFLAAAASRVGPYA